jgi:hypothetical protein
MSALGQKRTCAVQKGMSALPPIATAKADFPHKVTSALPSKADIKRVEAVSPPSPISPKLAALIRGCHRPYGGPTYSPRHWTLGHFGPTLILITDSGIAQASVAERPIALPPATGKGGAPCSSPKHSIQRRRSQSDDAQYAGWQCCLPASSHPIRAAVTSEPLNARNAHLPRQ